MAIEEQALAHALDVECRRHGADTLTVLTAAARLVAGYCIFGGLATSPRKKVARAVDAHAEAFLRILAAHLAHAGAKLQAPPH